MNSVVLKLFATGLNSKTHVKRIQFAYFWWDDMDQVSSLYYRGFMKATSGMAHKARIRLLCDLCFDLALQINHITLSEHKSSQIFVFIKMIKETHKVFRQARWLHFHGYMESIRKDKPGSQIRELCKLSTELALFNISPEVLFPKVVS
jgi:hypothetical protein